MSSPITLGLGGSSGALVTKGFGAGFFGSIVNYFKDGWYRFRKRTHGARVKLLDLSISGNVLIPLALTKGIVANFSSPYEDVFGLCGNNKIKAQESFDVKGNYKTSLLFDSTTLKGKKDFRRLILELLLDDET